MSDWAASIVSYTPDSLATGRFLATKPLPLIGNVYTFNPHTEAYTYITSIGSMLKRPVLKSSINGGFQPITIELPLSSQVAIQTIGASQQYSGTVGSPTAILGAGMTPAGKLASTSQTTTITPALAKGQVVRLLEQGGDGSILYTGIIEDILDTIDNQAQHQLALTPMVVQLGNTPYDATWNNVPLEIIAQDIVNQCPMLSWTPTSIAPTGVVSTLSFVQQSALQSLQTVCQAGGPNYYFFCDEIGVVWLSNVNFVQTPTHVFSQGADIATRKFSAPVQDLCNFVQIIGGPASYDSTTILKTSIGATQAVPFTVDINNWRAPPVGPIPDTTVVGVVVTIDSEQMVVNPIFLGTKQQLVVMHRAFNATALAPHAIGSTVTVSALSPTAPATLIATYDATASSPYPKRALNPPPVFNTITDQATLQSIANTIGTHLNREIAKIEVILPVYGNKVRLGGPAGSTAAYWEPANLPTIESYAGLGALSPTYVITDIEIDGGVQKLILSDLPFTADDMQYLVNNTITSAVVASSVQAVVPATAVIPVGAMLPFPVNVNIVGWLACNGSAFNATTYPTLARLLGGNTVPDMRDRLPMGANALGVVPIGQNAGSASHKLLQAEMPVYPSDHPVAATGTTASVAQSTVGVNTPFTIIPPVLGVAWYIKAL